MKVKYNSKEELIANLKLTIAKKNEYVAKVQREWAEQNVQRLRSKLNANYPKIIVVYL